MSDLTPNKIHLEVYLEGVKIPVTGVTINEAIGSPPSCTINFPAHSGALRILPGTLVHIFGLVEMLPGLGQTKKIIRQNVLLFEGEISGQSYTKTSSQRQISLTAQSLLHKWTQVYMHSADMLSDKLLFNALFIYQDWADLEKQTEEGAPKTVDADGNPTQTESPIKPKQDGTNKYLRFEYAHTLKGLNDLEHFVFQAWAGPNADVDARDRGDWMPFFLDLIKHLEYLNLYYGLFSKTYRLAETNFIFPNIQVKDALSQFLAERTMLQTPTEMSERIAMIDILLQILGMINYVMLIPAAPTYTVHPYLDLNRVPHNGLGDFGEVPMRTFMLPDTKFSVPASCNIIFPDEVERMDFTRNMSGEYTRMFCGASPTSLKVDASNFGDFQSVYVVPGLPFVTSESDDTKPASTQYLMGFTPEETYRGVNPVRSNFSGLEYGFLKALASGPGGTPPDESTIAQTWSPTSPAGKVAYNTALLSFYTSRYSARQCNLTCNWSPFRIVGLPALFFDVDGSPSITGVLAQHTVTISADGTARSDMTLALPRIFYDIEGLDAVDYILPSNINLQSTELKTLEQMDKEVLKHSTMEADPVPWIPEWYDKQWYGQEYIGRDVYSIISGGTRALWTNPDTSEAEKDSAWTRLDVLPAPAFSEEVRKRYNATAKWSTKVDYSIFEFIRKTSTAEFRPPQPNDRDAGLTPESGDSEEAVVAKRLAYSIRELKRRYFEAQTNDRLKTFIINTTNRNLTPKGNYWRFIGIGLDSPDDIENPFQLSQPRLSWKSYYKPTIQEGSYKDHVLGITPGYCKEILQQFYNEELDWGTAMKTFKLHPFVAKRRDHVLTMTSLVDNGLPRVGR